MTANEWLAIAPFLIVSGLAIGIVIIDMIWPRRKGLIMVAGIVGLLAAMAVTIAAGPIPGGGALPASGQSVFGGVYVRDQLTCFLDLLFISIALLTILFAPDYLEPRGLPLAEFTATLLFAISGAMLLGAGRDLLILFLGLELLVLPGYMLAGLAKHDGLSVEGAIKYFLLGSFSSAILLFGLTFVFGYTGTTNVTEIGQHLGDIAGGFEPLPVALGLGLALITAGAGFKIAAVPFHYWTPDAYQGSPTPVTGYLSVAPKVAAFALVLRLFVEMLGPLKDDWWVLIAVLAVLTMTLGNLAALGQDNVKRMLAYSSIAHTGYIMVGLAVYGGVSSPSVQESAIQGVLFYLAAYSFMNLGAFAIVAALQRRPGVTSQISSFAGLGRRAPLLGVAMTLFLLSLVGIPPTAGFWGKALIVISAVEGGQWFVLLAVILMLNATAAAFYYLRVVVTMYMREAPEHARPVTVGGWTKAGLLISAAAVVVIGLVPPVTQPMLDWTLQAARTLIGA